MYLLNVAPRNTRQYSLGKMTVNYEFERMWKEAKWLSWENNKILSHNRQQPDNNFKRGIPQIGVRNVGT